MSFDRPWTRTTPPRGSPVGRWAIPRTSPSPPPAGNLTSSVSAATTSNGGADTQGWRAKLINTVRRVRAIRGTALANTTIRPMEDRDIARAVEIESAIMGPKRSTTLRGSLTAYLSKGERNACLVAETDGKVVGFLVGDIRGW